MERLKTFDVGEAGEALTAGELLQLQAEAGISVVDTREEVKACLHHQGMSPSLESLAQAKYGFRKNKKRNTDPATQQKERNSKREHFLALDRYFIVQAWPTVHAALKQFQATFNPADLDNLPYSPKINDRGMRRISILTGVLQRLVIATCNDWFSQRDEIYKQHKFTGKLEGDDRAYMLYRDLLQEVSSGGIAETNGVWSKVKTPGEHQAAGYGTGIEMPILFGYILYWARQEENLGLTLNDFRQALINSRPTLEILSGLNNDFFSLLRGSHLTGSPDFLSLFRIFRGPQGLFVGLDREEVKTALRKRKLGTPKFTVAGGCPGMNFIPAVAEVASDLTLKVIAEEL